MIQFASQSQIYFLVLRERRVSVAVVLLSFFAPDLAVFVAAFFVVRRLVVFFTGESGTESSLSSSPLSKSRGSLTTPFLDTASFLDAVRRELRVLVELSDELRSSLVCVDVALPAAFLERGRVGDDFFGRRDCLTGESASVSSLLSSLSASMTDDLTGSRPARLLDLPEGKAASKLSSSVGSFFVRLPFRLLLPKLLAVCSVSNELERIGALDFFLGLAPSDCPPRRLRPALTLCSSVSLLSPSSAFSERPIRGDSGASFRLRLVARGGELATVLWDPICVKPSPFFCLRRLEVEWESVGLCSLALRPLPSTLSSSLD
mmetsp:Transcript_15433/g.22688  ORF Transcript_15433/g.22688 Transcript_15433/m.22688 type:complete len:318 (-) Transcript_15433:1559-2512(-)